MRADEGFIEIGTGESTILVFDLIWIYFASARHPRVGAMAFLTSPAIAWVWVVTAALAVLALKQCRKLARELETLISLRQQIGERAEGEY